jgi:hypothetical protein
MDKLKIPGFCYRLPFRTLNFKSLKILFMKSLLLLFFISTGLLLKAQNQLIFSKLDSSKTIIIKLKDLVRFSYSGYMAQHQEVEGRISAINDSTVTLQPRKRILQRTQPSQTIFIKNITGFRKYSNFRPASEIIYSVAGVGITGTAAAIVNNANLSPALNFVSAAATQTLISGLRNTVLSSKIKNRLNNGWSMQLQPIIKK